MARDNLYEHTENFEQNEQKSKKEEIETLLEGEPDCLYILGQGIKENRNANNVLANSNLPLKSTSYSARYNDGFEDLIIAGKARVIAAKELTDNFPETQIVACSRAKMQLSNFTEKTTVSLASVMSQELQRLGVDKNKIIMQERSYSVFTELIELVKLIVKNKWGHVVVLTNEYQILRCQTMFERIDSLKDPN